MNISEAINAVDVLKPNAFSLGEKVSWLSDIDWQIYREIIEQHEDAQMTDFSGYDASTSGDTQLIAPPPYDVLYPRYLCAQIDYYDNELARYNNSAMMFNLSYMNFFNYYNRTHKPKSEKLRT